MHVTNRANEEIASLIGHYYGDGSIITKKPQFKFCNFDKVSLNEVKLLVAKQFESTPINVTETTVTYSTIIGEILLLFGAQRGSKLKLKNDVPTWITNGSDGVKSRFVRALFDDDGSVSSSGNNKNINFHQIVFDEYNQYSIRFLKSVVKILEGFEIITHGPYLSRKYQISQKERNVNFLIISDWKSLENYKRKVDFFHSKKKKRIIDVLSRKKTLGKHERNLLYKKIIHLFHPEEEPLSTAFISEKLDISTRAALKRLKNLQSNKKVTFEGRVRNRSFLWKLNGGETKYPKDKISKKS
jgi:hypothetical protein